jgi:hypothetical protein
MWLPRDILACCAQRPATADDTLAAQQAVCCLRCDPRSAAPGTILGTLRLLDAGSGSMAREHRYVLRRYPGMGDEIIMDAFWSDMPWHDEWIRLSRPHVPAPGLVWLDETL